MHFFFAELVVTHLFNVMQRSSYEINIRAKVLYSSKDVFIKSCNGS